MRLPGSRCLVIGGARRLGRELALDLASAGAAVCVTSRTRDAAIDDGTAALRRAGAAAAAVIVGDVSAPASAGTLVAAAAAALGGLDVLLFTASGPFVPRPPETVDETAWDASFDTIAKGFFFAACAAREAFLATPAPAARVGSAETGVVVAITDHLGLHPWAAFAAHGAAKAAQIHLVQSLALAWADDGVRVCGVAPGPVDLADDEHRAATLRAAARVAGERLVTPAQVAAIVRRCIEDETMTGENVVVEAKSARES